MRESDNEARCLVRRVDCCGCVSDTDVFFLDPDLWILTKEKPGWVENSRSGFASIGAGIERVYSETAASVPFLITIIFPAVPVVMKSRLVLYSGPHSTSPETGLNTVKVPGPGSPTCTPFE